MRSSKSLLHGLTGFLAALALILACGQNSPVTDAGAADAASCNCPAPTPIPDGRVRYVKATATINPGDTFKALDVSCVAPPGAMGATLLAGGCDIVELGDPNKLILTRSSLVGIGTVWECQWENPQAVSVTLRATAICLVPPGTPDAGP